MRTGIPVVPRLIVEVRGGRSNGAKAVIDAGATLRFGRTEIADVAVPHDEMLSSVHFEIAWDGARGQLRDRKSLTGTTLNGEPALRAAVSDGDWIRAGKTDFLVYGECVNPLAGLDEDVDPEDDEAPALLDPVESERRRQAGEALSALRAEAGRAPLYAILDAARDERILPILRGSVERHQSLYEGTDGEALEDVAPYLCGPMRADSVLLDRLVGLGWGRRWGVYTSSHERFEAVRRHYRRFLLMVLEETEEKVYFRFYDPWVLENLPDERAGGDDEPWIVHYEGAGGLCARRAFRFDRSRLDGRRFEHLARKVEGEWDAAIVERFATAYAGAPSDVARLVDMGLRCGFERGPDLAAFVDLTLFTRPDWLSSGAPPTDLLDRAISPQDKLDRLATLAAFEPAPTEVAP